MFNDTKTRKDRIGRDHSETLITAGLILAVVFLSALFLELAGFTAWVLSEQAPPADGYWLGKLTFHGIRIIIG